MGPDPLPPGKSQSYQDSIQVWATFLWFLDPLSPHQRKWKQKTKWKQTIAKVELNPSDKTLMDPHMPWAIQIYCIKPEGWIGKYMKGQGM